MLHPLQVDRFKDVGAEHQADLLPLLTLSISLRGVEKMIKLLEDVEIEPEAAKRTSFLQSPARARMTELTAMGPERINDILSELQLPPLGRHLESHKCWLAGCQLRVQVAIHKRMRSRPNPSTISA